MNCMYSGGISVSHTVNVQKFGKLFSFCSQIECFSKESDPDDIWAASLVVLCLSKPV